VSDILVKIEFEQIGEDHLLKVAGGTKPHIGAVVIGTFQEHEVHVQSIGLPHHKEEALFIKLAQTWCERFKQTTVITGGIHIDNATQGQIHDLVKETWSELSKRMLELSQVKPDIDCKSGI
jgi:hypothetical protein